MNIDLQIKLLKHIKKILDQHNSDAIPKVKAAVDQVTGNEVLEVDDQAKQFISNELILSLSKELENIRDASGLLEAMIRELEENKLKS